MLPLLLKTLQWIIYQAIFFPSFYSIIKVHDLHDCTAYSFNTTCYPFSHFN